MRWTTAQAGVAAVVCTLFACRQVEAVLMTYQVTIEHSAGLGLATLTGSFTGDPGADTIIDESELIAWNFAWSGDPLITPHNPGTNAISWTSEHDNIAFQYAVTSPPTTMTFNRFEVEHLPDVTVFYKPNVGPQVTVGTKVNVKDTNGNKLSYTVMSANITAVPSPAPSPAPIPEPSTLLLLSTGFVGLVGYSWRRKLRA